MTDKLITLVSESRNENVSIDSDRFFPIFLEWFKTVDHCSISFDGDGAYSGRQISIVDNQFFNSQPLLDFEVAYSNESIVVYRKDHHGFWVNPYSSISNKDENFHQYYTDFIYYLSLHFGVKE